MPCRVQSWGASKVRSASDSRRDGAVVDHGHGLRAAMEHAGLHDIARSRIVADERARAIARVALGEELVFREAHAVDPVLEDPLGRIIRVTLEVVNNKVLLDGEAPDIACPDGLGLAIVDLVHLPVVGLAQFEEAAGVKARLGNGAGRRIRASPLASVLRYTLCAAASRPARQLRGTRGSTPVAPEAGVGWRVATGTTMKRTSLKPDCLKSRRPSCRRCRS